MLVVASLLFLGEQLQRPSIPAEDFSIRWRSPGGTDTASRTWLEGRSVGCSKSAKIVERCRKLARSANRALDVPWTLGTSSQLGTWRHMLSQIKSTSGDEVALLTAAAGLHCAWRSKKSSRELELSLQTDFCRGSNRCGQLWLAFDLPSAVCLERLQRHDR